jgi:hypothetical protein
MLLLGLRSCKQQGGEAIADGAGQAQIRAFSGNYALGAPRLLALT